MMIAKELIWYWTLYYLSLTVLHCMCHLCPWCIYSTTCTLHHALYKAMIVPWMILLIRPFIADGETLHCGCVQEREPRYNIIYLVRELYLGDRMLDRKLFSQCSLDTSERCAANNLFIHSSPTRCSRLLSACWTWRCNSSHSEKVWGMRSEFSISCGRG